MGLRKSIEVVASLRAVSVVLTRKPLAFFVAPSCLLRAYVRTPLEDTILPYGRWNHCLGCVSNAWAQENYAHSLLSRRRRAAGGTGRWHQAMTGRVSRPRTGVRGVASSTEAEGVRNAGVDTDDCVGAMSTVSGEGLVQLCGLCSTFCRRPQLPRQAGQHSPQPRPLEANHPVATIAQGGNILGALVSEALVVPVVNLKTLRPMADFALGPVAQGVGSKRRPVFGCEVQFWYHPCQFMTIV
jgi:hypothetical protein